MLDQTGCIAFCNRAAAALLGSTVDDLTGRAFGIPVMSAEAAPVEIFTGDKPIFVEMHSAPVPWHGGEAALISLRNVTDRCDAETRAALQTQALEGVANGIFIADKNGLVLWANRALENMSGYARGEIVGQSVTLFQVGRARPTPSMPVSGSVFFGGRVRQGRSRQRPQGRQSLHCRSDHHGDRRSHRPACRTNFVAIQEEHLRAPSAPRASSSA